MSLNQLITNALAATIARPDTPARRQREPAPRSLRLVLAANLVAILLATTVALALLVLALTRLG